MIRIFLSLAFAGLVAGAALAASIDPARLPLGDGRISSEPRVGHVWPCRTEGFGTRREHGGPWIRGDGTFDFANKPYAEGDVKWPHDLRIELAGDKRVIVGNDLPNHGTGVFPKSPSDPTYQYSPNPHPILPQNVLFELPARPELAAQPSCVPMGPIGILFTGAFIFNALDANGQDAVAHEIQDKCQGHPERRGAYHYHNLTSCLKDEGTGHSALMGYAFDGFGVYGKRGENGKPLTNEDLDACHGHTHVIDWDGKPAAMYHYHATAEYPYTVSCYRGTSERRGRRPR